VAAAAVLDRGGGAGWGRRCWTEPEVLPRGGGAGRGRRCCTGRRCWTELEVLQGAEVLAGGGGVAGNGTPWKTMMRGRRSRLRRVQL
jgi:hypothetical protein